MFWYVLLAVCCFVLFRCVLLCCVVCVALFCLLHDSMRSGTSEWDPGDSALPPIPTQKSASSGRACRTNLIYSTKCILYKLELHNQVLVCRSFNYVSQKAEGKALLQQRTAGNWIDSQLNAWGIITKFNILHVPMCKQHFANWNKKF